MNNKEAKTLFLRNLYVSLATAACVFAMSSVPAKAWNCVQFVHQVSSLKISGDAWQWWKAALGRYDRGKSPERNAVLVFDHTRRMIHGHVAVVADLVNKRIIEIDHANWSIGRYGRGKIARHVRVQDVSDKNDWSMIEVWNELDHCWGHPYKALGFIYSH
jgi:surface antigen